MPMNSEDNPVYDLELREQIQGMKRDGFTSSDVADILHVKLSIVNAIWPKV